MNVQGIPVLYELPVATVRGLTNANVLTGFREMAFPVQVRFSSILASSTIK